MPFAPENILPMLRASQIAAKLPGEWVLEKQGTAHLNSQTRVSISVSTNSSFHALGYIDQADCYADSEAFADDLLEVIGGHLAPLLELDLVKKLGKSLIEWQLGRGAACAGEDPVGDLLKELLALDRTSDDRNLIRYGLGTAVAKLA